MSVGCRGRWTGAAFGAEAALFLAATAVALGYRSGLSNEPTRLHTVIVLTGLAMGIRNATVRKLALPDLTTTVLTLTLTGLAADSALAGGANPRAWRRGASVLSMFLGAAVGALLLRHSLVLPLVVSSVLSSSCAIAVALTRPDADAAPAPSAPA